MNWILIIIIALLFSAFFSGMEIAFVSSNKVRVELDMKQQGMMSKILGLFYGNEEQFISTMLVGNNIALVIYGMGMAALLEPVIALVWNQEAFVVLMQTLLSTLLILFVGEFLPKTIFRVNPNATMRFFSPFVWLLYVVLYPISKFTSVVSKCVMRLGGVKIAHQPYGALMSKIELDSFIQKSIEESDSGEPVEPEMKIFPRFSAPKNPTFPSSRLLTDAASCGCPSFRTPSILPVSADSHAAAVSHARLCTKKLKYKTPIKTSRTSDITHAASIVKLPSLLKYISFNLVDL